MITVGVETEGAEALRDFIEAASPEHPSLVDSDHVMERAFGVVNIPNVVWIDEAGVIARPAEPGWGGPQDYPKWLADVLAEAERKAIEAGGQSPYGAGQNRDSYADIVRDWAAKGAESQYALTPNQVIAASQPRDAGQSEAAARFELGADAWRADDRESAFAHWRETHRLDPNNWAYKRQAWSLVGNEAADGGELGRFLQFGIDDSWPFDGDFNRDRAAVEPGDYYPRSADL